MITGPRGSQELQLCSRPWPLSGLMAQPARVTVSMMLCEAWPPDSVRLAMRISSIEWVTSPPGGPWTCYRPSPTHCWHLTRGFGVPCRGTGEAYCRPVHVHAGWSCSFSCRGMEGNSEPVSHVDRHHLGDGTDVRFSGAKDGTLAFNFWKSTVSLQVPEARF